MDKIAMALVLVTTMGAVAPASAAAAPTPSPRLVAEVQHRLQQARHDEVGPADGVYGGSTHAALWFFQRENNFVTTGEMDRETLRALGLGAAARSMPPAASFGATARDWPTAAGGGVFGTPLSRQ